MIRGLSISYRRSEESSVVRQVSFENHEHHAGALTPGMVDSHGFYRDSPLTNQNTLSFRSRQASASIPYHWAAKITCLNSIFQMFLATLVGYPNLLMRFRVQFIRSHSQSVRSCEAPMSLLVGGGQALSLFQRICTIWIYRSRG